MGADMGFDMVPRLTRSEPDKEKWRLFIRAVRESFKGDERVKVHQHHIEFMAGEHPMLPFDGFMFLRFSSKVTGSTARETGVEDYLHLVQMIASRFFGDRVRPWSELADQYGFYDWSDVNHSTRSYIKGNMLAITHFANLEGPDYYPLRADVDGKLYEVLDIPGRGRGIVARCNIRSGTRVLCEKPLFILGNSRNYNLNLQEELIASKLRSLSVEERTQFLSMHNNYRGVPGRRPFEGTFKTNALPCGSDAVIGGVYLEICLVNHSCIPNCQNNWNPKTERETIHATRNILAGEEITISYAAGSHAERRQHLADRFGFECNCELCSSPTAELRASDDRRRQIALLDERIVTMMSQPAVGLRTCEALLRLLVEEYGSGDISLVARLYYDAFQLVICHGDQARAQVFAERAYRARVACEGEDSPVTQQHRAQAQEPASHLSFAGYSNKWKSSMAAKPRGLDEKEFEKWLWRR